MYLHEMNEGECRRLLAGAKVGRLACARDNQPYVLPINFAIDSRYLYAFTTLGQKVDWMRSNPLVCFEVDEIVNREQWASVVVFGRYEELPDIPEYEPARRHAHALLQERANWWEPAYVAQNQRDHPHSLTPIFFRIRIDKLTGHRASADESDNSAMAASEERRTTIRERPREARFRSFLNLLRTTHIFS